MSMVQSKFEDSPLTPFLKRLTLYSSGGPFLDGYLIIIMGIALSQLGPQLHLTAEWTGLVATSFLVGMLLGGALIGYLTDLWGRSLMYAFNLVAIIVLSVAQMFISSPLQLVVLRFIIGIVVGGDYPIATSLLAEFAPRKYRGAMLGLLMAMWYVGATAASIVGYYLADVSGSWRWMLGSAAIPSLLLVIGRFGTPESPRWLVSKGRFEDARKVLKKVYGPDADITDLGETSSQKTQFSKLFQAGYLKRTLFVGIFWMCQIIPVTALYMFGPMILKTFGLAEGNLSILGYAIINLFFMLGVIPALLWVNSMGRRPVVIWTNVVMSIALVVLGIFSKGAAWLIITCFAVYAFFNGTQSVLDWIYPNELFPTDVRASAVGLGTAMSRVGAAIAAFFIPMAMESMGIGKVTLIGAAVTIVGLVVSIAWAEETKGLTLAETSSIQHQA